MSARLPTALLLLSIVAVIKSASAVSVPIYGKHVPVEVIQKRTLARRDIYEQTVISNGARTAHPSSIEAPLGQGWQSIILNVPITIGTPPQTFNAILDTGMAPLFVPSSRCDPDAIDSCRSSFDHHFAANESSSYEPLYRGDFVAYEAWRIEGPLANETVHFGGLEMKSRTMLEGIDIRPQGFIALPGFDSAASLARPLSSISKQTKRDIDATAPEPDFHKRHPDFLSLLDTITADGLLEPSAPNHFTLRFPRLPDPSEPQHTGPAIGVLEIGEPLPAGHEDNLVTIPLATDLDPEIFDTEWVLDAHSLAFGSKELNLSAHGFNLAALKTADVFTGVPSELYKHIITVTGARKINPLILAIDCAVVPELPPFSIMLGPNGHEQVLIVEAEDYVVRIYNNTDNIGKGPDGEEGNGDMIVCHLPFFEDPGSRDGFIELGTAFLKGFWSVWNWEDNTVGFVSDPR